MQCISKASQMKQNRLIYKKIKSQHVLHRCNKTGTSYQNMLNSNMAPVRKNEFDFCSTESSSPKRGIKTLPADVGCIITVRTCYYGQVLDFHLLMKK